MGEGSMDQSKFERFDMKKPPCRTAWYLRPLTYILSAPDVKKHGDGMLKNHYPKGLRLFR